MPAELLARPGIALGSYPERAIPRLDRLQTLARTVVGPLSCRFQTRRARVRQFLARVHTGDRALAGLNDRAVTAVTRDLRRALGRSGLTDELLARAFAIVRQAADRQLGTPHYDCQLVGGWVIAKGMLAEMDTGEGKTLTATLPACAVALTGLPVHVITSNDYLARRDAELMTPVYQMLGLTVGVAAEGSSPRARRAAYACDVTYGTGKQITFDYLHDRVQRGPAAGRLQLELSRLDSNRALSDRLLMRGLGFVVVDEADSVLIDEARTPLILSQTRDDDAEHRVYAQALEIAGALVDGQHFSVCRRERRVTLSDAGRARLAGITATLGGVWAGKRRREMLAQQALSALHLFHRDRDYLVRDGKVQIIDEHTGRVMPDRAWEHGLHQMIELAEGCDPTGSRETLARISYQRFFRRYLRVGGMSGTLREVRTELRAVYGLDVVRVQPHRPSRRLFLGERVLATREAKWRAVVERVRRVQAAGRPVLIGTGSVAESERLSEQLQAAGIAHQVLNARQDAEEAEIVARAGEAGRVTVATNMAGRGTDIKLPPAVVERGGLHVIVAERNASARVDRQLVGRCSRQGEPGSYELIVSLEDELTGRLAPRGVCALARRLCDGDGAVPRGLGTALSRRAQRTLERHHARARRALLRLDDHLADALAFSGQA